jgi:CBS domain-containing protein
MPTNNQNKALETKRVSEIMIPLRDYPIVYIDQTLKDAMREMEICQIEFLGKKTAPRIILVFDLSDQLVGVARRRDIMRGLEPDFLVSKPLSVRKNLFDVQLDPNLSEMSYDRLLKGVFEHSKRPISDVMLPVVATIHHDDHIIKAIYEMVDRNQSLLPVLKDERVVGVLRSVDVFREFSRYILDPEDFDLDC